MKRASISLLCRLTRHRPPQETLSAATPVLTISRSYISVSSSTTHQLKSTNGLIFRLNPCRNYDTVRDPEFHDVRGKDRIEASFEEAETGKDMISWFKSMKNSGYFSEKELSLAALKIGFKLEQEGEDPQQILTYAETALDAIGDHDGKPSVEHAMALQLMGTIHYSLKRFSAALGYLNSANRILGRFEEEGSVDVEDVIPIMHAVLLDLFNVKTALGRREEAIENLKKCVEIKEMTLDKDSKELGVAYRDLAEAYVGVLNFGEALPVASKALEIHRSGLGNNSVEVAHDRKLLGIIYSGLEEHEKALQQNELAQKVLKNWGLHSDLLRAEIDASNMQIALGKYDEAVNTLKGVVEHTAQESETRALVFITMGKALCNQDKFTESKKYLQIACGILDKKDPKFHAEVAEAYSEIAMLYENMNEFESAISLLKRSLSLLEKKGEEKHSKGSIAARVGWLFLLTGKVSQAIPYLENAVIELQDSFGSKHYGVGYIYNNLGAAYLELDRPHTAAQMFALAKDIMDTALGPHHADSIEACQNLSKAYSAMRSYPLAIKFQQQVVDAWENYGPSAQEELTEARQQLKQLRENAHSAAFNKRLNFACSEPSEKKHETDVPLS